MSEGSDRLERTRLAIIQHIQQKQEKPGGLKQMLGSVAAAAGFGSRRPARSAEQPRPEPAAAPAASTAKTASSSPAQDQPISQAAERRVEQVVDATAQDIKADDYGSAPVRGPQSPAQKHERRARHLFGDRFAGLGEAGREYWNHHPARLVVELATPALSSYAQRHPARYLAMAAGAGALVYLARPWRLISVTGLAVAALRSPQLSSALISALYGRGGDGADGA